MEDRDDQDWHSGSKQSVSPCDFYAYRVQWRVDSDVGGASDEDSDASWLPSD